MKSAVVLVNLGTPDAPSAGGVRRFLREFLSDRRVVELPRLLWLPILYGIILPLRSPRVAKKYQRLWLGNESPLRFMSQSLANAIGQKLDDEWGDKAPQVKLAMTYGSSNISSTIHELLGQGVDHFLFVPLFPQYSATTTAAVLDRVGYTFSQVRNVPRWQWIKDYHDDPLYIQALATQVKNHWQQHGQAEKLLMSFHGIPKRNIDLGDPYRQQCEKTAELLADTLGLRDDQWILSFQSRLGKAEWLQPYTDKTVVALAQEGVKSLDVICPAFATECLETLEEIDDEAASFFHENGGETFNYIPCLNDSEDHQLLIINLIKKEIPIFEAR